MHKMILILKITESLYHKLCNQVNGYLDERLELERDLKKSMDRMKEDVENFFFFELEETFNHNKAV